MNRDERLKRWTQKLANDPAIRARVDELQERLDRGDPADFLTPEQFGEKYATTTQQPRNEE